MAVRLFIVSFVNLGRSDFFYRRYIPLPLRGPDQRVPDIQHRLAQGGHALWRFHPSGMSLVLDIIWLSKYLFTYALMFRTCISPFEAETKCTELRLGCTWHWQAHPGKLQF